MRILQVHPTLTTIDGGVERHIKGLSKYLARNGHEVTIVTWEHGGTILCNAGRIAIRRDGKFSPWFDYGDFDIVHVHGYRVPSANFYGLIRKIKKNPVVMTTHGIYPSRSTIDAIRKKIYDFSLGKISLDLFDVLIALTPETERSLLSLGAEQEKVRVIPNALDTELYEHASLNVDFLRRYGLTRKSRILLYVGRIDWNKGLDLALRAVASVMKVIPKVVFLVVGQDCGYVSSLRRLASRLGILDSLVFTGRVDEKTLLSAYAAADLFLFTSAYEGLPTVLLEAMCCGIPIVATSTGGTPYLITHGETGFLVDHGEIENLVEMITLVLNDYDLNQEVARRAKNYVEKHYSWKTNSRKIEEVYRNCVS